MQKLCHKMENNGDFVRMYLSLPQDVVISKDKFTKNCEKIIKICLVIFWHILYNVSEEIHSDIIRRKHTMKVSLTKMWRSGLALLLAICLVAGFVPGVAFAAPQDAIQKQLDKVVEVIKAKAPEASEAVLAYWEANGYDEDVETAIAELRESLEARIAEYEGKQVVIEETIAALTEQKDALVVELAALKADLDAKQAELVAIVAGMDIGSIHTPDINIGVGLGGNTQTQVPDHEHHEHAADVKEQLEAAIHDLEHAIAVVEALISDIEADISDMVELAKQIANAVAELKLTVTDIIEAVEEVKSAYIAIKEVLNGEIVAEAYELARAEVLKAVANLEEVVALGAEIAADAEELIAEAVAKVEVLTAKIVNDLPTEIKGIPLDPKVLVAGAVYVAKAKLEAELPGKIEEIKLEYADEIEQAKKDLEELKVKIETEVEEKYPAVKEAVEAEFAAKKVELEAAKAALEAELKAAQADLAAKTEELAKATDAAIKAELEAAIAPLQAQVERLTKDIATVNADLEHMTEHLDAALKLAHDQLVAEVTAAYEKAIAELEKAIADLEAKVKAEIEALEKAVEEQIAALEKAIIDAIADTLKAIEDQLKVIEEAFKDELKGIADAVEALKNALIDAGINSIEELVDALVKVFEDMLYAATHADLTIDYDFKYVALGDGTAVAEGYAEALAALLTAEAEKNGIKKGIDFVNNAKVGNTVAAEAANLSADVADADLITLGFSQTEMMGKALKIVMAGENVNWAALLGEAAVPYVEEALAKVNAEVDATVENAEVAALVKAVLEAYAYGAVEYAVKMPALLYAIRTVNKEAIVINVGMYNPLDGVAVAGFDLSQFNDYFNYLIDGVAVYGIGLAMVTNQIDYVDARDVEVAKATLSVQDLTKLAQGDVSALYPSEAGEDYIAAQIAKALNLSFAGLLGDVDGNGKVNGFDLLRLKKYLAGENVEIVAGNSDTTMDGAINGFDALRLQKYLAGAIESL